MGKMLTVDPHANRDNVAFLSALGCGFAVAIIVGASIWLTVPMVGMLAVAGYLHRRDRRRFLRHVHGQCVECGYDLRATPGRCPECGSIRVG